MSKLLTRDWFCQQFLPEELKRLVDRLAGVPNTCVLKPQAQQSLVYLATLSLEQLPLHLTVEPICKVLSILILNRHFTCPSPADLLEFAQRNGDAIRQLITMSDSAWQHLLNKRQSILWQFPDLIGAPLNHPVIGPTVVTTHAWQRFTERFKIRHRDIPLVNMPRHFLMTFQEAVPETLPDRAATFRLLHNNAESAHYLRHYKSNLRFVVTPPDAVHTIATIVTVETPNLPIAQRRLNLPNTG